MRNTLLSAVRDYVRTGARLWGDVLSSGAFFSRWTLAVSFVVSVTILGMYVAASGHSDYLRGLIISVMVWAIAVAALLPVAYAERRIRSRLARGALVVTAVLLVSIARPILHDVLGAALFGYPMLVDWVPRMVTNAVSWLPVLSIVAAAVLGYRAATVTRARLAAAIEDLSRARNRLADYAAANEDLIGDLLRSLRTGRDRMLAGPIGFDAVSAYAAGVRAASHTLDDRSRVTLDAAVVRQAPDAAARMPVPFLARLRPPPPVLVGAIVLAGSAAHMYTLGGIGVLLLAVLIVPACALAADALTRWVGARTSAEAAGAWFLVIWTAAGGLATLAAAAMVPGIGPERLVPLVAFPGVAVASGLGSDAVYRASVNIRRLTTVLGADAQELAERAARARGRARRAADALHGRVQGRCVLLAAAADERAVSAEEVAAFRRSTDLAFADIGADSTDGDAEVDVPALLAAWSGVVAVDATIGQDAAFALGHGETRRRAADVVNEALINVVKHARARAAHILIDGDERNGVRIRVTSPGHLHAAGTSRGRGIETIPGRARLHQVGDDVVLEVDLPSSTADAGDASVIEEDPSIAEVADAVLRQRW